MDSVRHKARIRMKTLLVDRFYHAANWPAKVRNVSKVGSQFPTTSISYTLWLTGFGRSILAATVANNAVFSNGFAHPPLPTTFSGSETERPGAERNRQGFGRTPRFLPPNSQFLWSTGAFG